MTVTKDQAQMLASLAAACRPNGARRWDTAGILAALEKVRDRSLPEVVLATIRAAADRAIETPGVIPTPGAHWREQLAPLPFVPKAAPTGTRCTVCGDPEDTHRLTDHDYRRPHEKADPESIHTAVAALRDGIEAVKDPTPPKTLDDLRAANPKFAAKLDAVRAALPAAPMREAEPADDTGETA